MKKFQLLKWTAEVSEKELQHLESVDLLIDYDPVVIFVTRRNKK
jgi:hypothetical protein